MFFQTLTFDISVITVSSTGRVLFYDQNSNLVVAIKKTDDFQLHYSENFLYIWKEGNKPVWVNGGTEMTMAQGSLYKMTVWGLTDIDGKPFTAISDTSGDYEGYLAKQQEAFEWLQEVVLAGCCASGSGSSSVAFYTDFASFPATGTVDVLYVDKATPALYLWDGSAYVPFGSSSGVSSVTGNIVDNTDPSNPVVTQVQADWDETDNTQPDYILNKPDLPTLYWPLAGNAGGPNYVTGSIEVDPSVGGWAISETQTGLTTELGWEAGVLAYIKGVMGSEVGRCVAQPTQSYIDCTDGTNSSVFQVSSAQAQSSSSNGTDITQIDIYPTYAQVFSTYATFEGVKYFADYSANFVDRSLVDKAYVDGLVGDYIPLAGTASGSPVTGDIELDKSVGFYSNDTFFLNELFFLDPTYGGDGILIRTTDLVTLAQKEYLFSPSQELLLSVSRIQDIKPKFWTKAGTPTTTDDSSQGYLVGSLIWDTTNSILYKCTDNTASAATWVNALSTQFYDTVRVGTTVPAAATRYTCFGYTSLSSIAVTNIAPPKTHTDFRVTLATAQPASGSLDVIRTFTSFAGATLHTDTLTIPAGSAIGVYAFTSGSYDASAGCNYRFDLVNNAPSVPSGNINGIENTYQ